MIATTAGERAEFVSGGEQEGLGGLKMPPSEKALEVFQLVEIVGLSTREAAREAGVSQTRVIQLRDAVEEWICAQSAGSERRTKQQQLRLAEYKANARLDHLYSQAMEGWKNSQGEEVLQYGDSSGQTRVVIRQCHGKASYLNLAIRVVMAQAKLAVTLAKGSESAAAPNAEERPSQPDCLPATPSEEDCSPAAAQPDGCGEARRAGGDVNGSAAEACNSTAEPVSAVSRVNRVESSPVQPASALVERLNQLPVERVLEGLPLTDRIRQEAAKRVGDPRQQRRKAFLSGK
jgi:hypothetical protein